MVKSSTFMVKQGEIIHLFFPILWSAPFFKKPLRRRQVDAGPSGHGSPELAAGESFFLFLNGTFNKCGKYKTMLDLDPFKMAKLKNRKTHENTWSSSQESPLDAEVSEVFFFFFSWSSSHWQHTFVHIPTSDLFDFIWFDFDGKKKGLWCSNISH